MNLRRGQYKKKICCFLLCGIDLPKNWMVSFCVTLLTETHTKVKTQPLWYGLFAKYYSLWAALWKLQWLTVASCGRKQYYYTAAHSELVSVWNTVDISATRYIAVFDITSKLLFIHILLKTTYIPLPPPFHLNINIEIPSVRRTFRYQ